MERYFGYKTQYTDYEYDLAMDLEIFQTKKEAIKDKFNKYMYLEEMLNMGEESIWYNLLRDRSNPSITDDKIKEIHEQFGLTQRQVKQWFKVLCRGYPKKRTLVFYGASNCGKSLLANALMSPIAPAYIQRDGGTNVHWLENLYRKSVVLWEEPSIHMSNIEDVKLLLGGETLPINRKNKQIIERPKGPAVLITTNNQFWYYQPQTLLNRIFIFEFNNTIDKFIEEKDLVSYLMQIYDGRFNE